MADNEEYDWVGTADAYSSSLNIFLNMMGLGSQIPNVKDTVKDWSQCQTLGPLEQLKLGIRYFDLDVAYDEITDKIRFAHGLYARNIEDDLQVIADWAVNHQQEVVILHFAQYFNFAPGSVRPEFYLVKRKV